MKLARLLTSIFEKAHKPGSVFPEIVSKSDAVTLNDGLVAPLRYLPDQNRAPTALRAESGVYSKDGEFVALSRLVRNGNRLTFPAQFEAETTEQRNAVYCGRWFDHFGHFILESLARLWCSDDYPDHVLCWSVPEGETARPKQWQLDLVKFLCGERELMFINEPTRFLQVVVPKAGFEIPGRFSTEHVRFLRSHGRPYAPMPKTFLWLSRSKVEPAYGLLNSDVLELHLAATGWQIIYPELLSVEEQVNLLAGAERIAGEEGSALHMLMLVQNPQDLQVDLFPRRSKPETAKKHYDMIATQVGFKQVLHRLQSETRLDRNGNRFLRIAPNFAEHLAALKVPIRQENREKRKASSNTFRDAISDAARNRSYLQIGTSKHFGFEDISAASKTLITQSACMDPRTFDGQKEKLFETSFAEYLEHFQPADDQYDVVLVGDEFGELDIEKDWKKIATSRARNMNKELKPR